MTGPPAGPPVDRPLGLARWLRAATVLVALLAAAGAALGGAAAAAVVPVLAVVIVGRLVWLSGRWGRAGERRAALQAAALAFLCAATWLVTTR